MINYYLFSNDNSLSILKDKYKNTKMYKIVLTEERIKRLFASSQNIMVDEYDLLVLPIEDKDFVSATEFTQYFNDCSKKIKSILNNYTNILGYSSKSQNKKIESIIDFSSANKSKIISKMYGENGWNSLKEFFECLKKSDIKYVSLRKNEDLPNGFIDGDKDIDILCENKEELVRIFCLKKRSLGISGYKLLLKDDIVPIDVRFKGDNYFDASWEQKILDSRRLNENNVYVIDKENQIFTIIYHIMTQKNSVSTYYQKYLRDNGFFTECDKMIDLLSMYMNKNGYSFYKPVDLSVYQNKKNIKYLKSLTVKYSKLKIWTLNFLSKIPDILFIKKIKNYILNNEKF